MRWWCWCWCFRWFANCYKFQHVNISWGTSMVFWSSLLRWLKVSTETLNENVEQNWNDLPTFAFTGALRMRIVFLFVCIKTCVCLCASMY
jgi:hypothetical protein